MSRTLIFSPERDDWLKTDDPELEAACRLDFFKAAGPGGQKRNKTSNAVRCTHLPSGIAVSDCSGRRRHHNRTVALRKLRYRIALQVRMTPGTPPKRLDVSLTHADYPLFVAHILDILNDHEFRLDEAARVLDLSTARLIKLLKRDKNLWQAGRNFRTE
ncbi:MAG: peptide chain release factor-like protein [Victivallales bacterium]|nr:peptide chain release factor-like protein [Victivallales bacterium]